MPLHTSSCQIICSVSSAILFLKQLEPKWLEPQQHMSVLLAQVRYVTVGMTMWFKKTLWSTAEGFKDWEQNKNKQKHGSKVA